MKPAQWIAMLWSAGLIFWSIPLCAVEHASTAVHEQSVIRLGQISLSFYAVTGGVVQEVLERLGYTIEVSQAVMRRSFRS